MYRHFSRNPWLAAPGAALISLLLIGSARADVVGKQFQVSDGSNLELATDVGKIVVETGTSGQVSIEVQREGNRAEELDIQFDQRGDTVFVKGEFPEDDDRWSRKGRMRVEFTVKVPRRFNLNLSTSGGSIAVDDLDGTLRAHTSGGSLKFGRVEGEVDAHTSGGSIQLDSGGANVRVNTSGGSIRIGNVAGTVAARTSGGSIRIADVGGAIDATTSGGSVEARMLTQPGENSNLSTSGGQVTLYLADNIAVDIDATSSAGGVRSDFPLDGKTSDKRRLRGSINGGGPTVRLRSAGGRVTIRGMN